MTHFEDCICLPCVWGSVTSSSSDNLEIERRALEYRNQRRCYPDISHTYKPDTQQDRTEAMHQGVSSLHSNRQAEPAAAEPFYLDQTYDMPLEVIPKLHQFGGVEYKEVGQGRAQSGQPYITSHGDLAVIKHAGFYTGGLHILLQAVRVL